MIIDHENKVLISTPAKTATASMEAVARGRRAEEAPEGMGIVYWPDGQKKPHTMVIPDHISGVKNYKRYMLVRNPYQRLVSLYYWLKKPYHIPGEWPEKADDIRAIDTFSEFVHWWVRMRDEYGYNGRHPVRLQFSDPSFWMHPHCWMVTYAECASQFNPHYILHLEKLEAELKAIRGDWGFIPHRHGAGVDTSWQDHYGPKERKAVYSIFRADMLLGGYRLGVER